MVPETLQLLYNATYDSENNGNNRRLHLIRDSLDRLISKKQSKKQEIVFSPRINLELGKVTKRVALANDAVLIMGKNPSISDLNHRIIDEIRRLKRTIQFVKFTGLGRDNSVPDTALLYDPIIESVRIPTKRKTGGNTSTQNPSAVKGTALYYDPESDFAHASLDFDRGNINSFTDLPLVLNLNGFSAQWTFFDENENGQRITESIPLPEVYLRNPHTKMSLSNTQVSFKTLNRTTHYIGFAGGGGTNDLIKIRSLLYHFEQ